MNNIQHSSEGEMIIEFGITDDHFEFASSIASAQEAAEAELENLEVQLEESAETLQSLTPDCDRQDYMLAASCGALCGLMDIFLVGKPGESPVGEITDRWLEERTEGFARLCGWKGEGKSSAIAHLEEKFKIPYDQTGAGDAARSVFELNTRNHHFKSLGHNPTLLGLFFSILDQFGEQNQSHFVTGGKLISLQNADPGFELRGGDVPAKLFCAFVNWIGHLISDMSGSSGSKGRGMGIPSPLWTWSNDIIAIKSKLDIPVSEFDQSVNELALNIYMKGYDARFQTAQAIPVFINEITVRLIYSIRRMLRYYSTVPEGRRSFREMWKECEPFSNATVKRMLTVAHGTFCFEDMGDAVIRGFAAGGGAFDVTEFTMRLNVVGAGRFVFSLYGESRRAGRRNRAGENIYFLRREKTILEDYLAGLKKLSEIYDDRDLISFVEDLRGSDMYKTAFLKSAELAELRKVPEQKILRDKSDIDAFFRGK